MTSRTRSQDDRLPASHLVRIVFHMRWLLLAWFSLACLQAHPNHQLDLTYPSPAADWQSDSLPLGNGYFGALVMGGVAADTIRLTDPYTKDTEGRLQALGDLVIATGHDPKEARTFLRRLDLQTASVEVSYRAGRLRQRREYFCSYPDRVLVGRLRSIRKRSLNLTLSWENVLKGAMARSDTSANRLVLSGDGYEVVAEVRLKGGQLRESDDRNLQIVGADEVALILTLSQNEAFSARKHLDQLKHDDAVGLYQRHLPDYQDQFHAMYLTLEGGGKSHLATNRRREAYAATPEEDPSFEELLFQYGRYLYIASHRKGGPLPTAQGIWGIPSRALTDGFLDLMHAGAAPTQLFTALGDSFDLVQKLPEQSESSPLSKVASFYQNSQSRQANLAYEQFRSLLKEDLADNLLVKDRQVLANMAIVRSVCDLFGREQDATLYLADNLPKAWTDGSVVGLRTPNYEVAYVWQESEFVEGYLTRLSDGEAVVASSIPLLLDRAGSGEEPQTLTPDATNVVRFPMQTEVTLRLRRPDPEE